MDTFLWYIETALDYGLQMLPVVAASAVLFFLLMPLKRRVLTCRGLHSSLWREGALLIFVMFCMGLAALTLSPPGFWYQVLHGYPIWIPDALMDHSFYWGITIFRDLTQGGSWVFFMLLGNIGMFIPLGFFPALLWDKPVWYKSALIGLCASTFIEIVQLFLPRSSDINDIILNTFGALCGFWVYLLLSRFAPRFVSKFELQRTEAPNGREAGNKTAP